MVAKCEVAYAVQALLGLLYTTDSSTQRLRHDRCASRAHHVRSTQSVLAARHSTCGTLTDRRCWSVRCSAGDTALLQQLFEL